MRMTLAAMLAVLVMSVAAADEPKVSIPAKQSPPISAIGVTSCGRAIVIYVTVDPTHMLRLDAASSTMFTLKADGTVEESVGPPLSIEKALDIALAASIQANVALPCNERII